MRQKKRLVRKKCLRPCLNCPSLFSLEWEALVFPPFPLFVLQSPHGVFLASLSFLRKLARFPNIKTYIQPWIKGWQLASWELTRKERKSAILFQDFWNNRPNCSTSAVKSENLSSINEKWLYKLIKVFFNINFIGFFRFHLICLNMRHIFSYYDGA